MQSASVRNRNDDRNTKRNGLTLRHARSFVTRSSWKALLSSALKIVSTRLAEALRARCASGDSGGARNAAATEARQDVGLDRELGGVDRAAVHAIPREIVLRRLDHGQRAGGGGGAGRAHLVREFTAAGLRLRKGEHADPVGLVVIVGGTEGVEALLVLVIDTAERPHPIAAAGAPITQGDTGAEREKIAFADGQFEP